MVAATALLALALGASTDSVKTAPIPDSAARATPSALAAGAVPAPMDSTPAGAPGPVAAAPATPKTDSVATSAAPPAVVPGPVVQAPAAAKTDSVPQAPKPLVVVPGPVGPVPQAGPTPQVGPVAVPAPSTFGPVGPVAPARTAGPVIAGPTMVVGIDTAGSGTSGRSTAAAMGLSLLVPGWGHRYLGYTGRSTPYFAADLAGWVALFGSWMTGKIALTNAAEVANRHAGAQLGSNPDEDLLSAMRTYRSRRQTGGRHDSYNEAMVLSGKSPTSEFADDDAHNWDWGSRENPSNDAHIRSFENQLRLWRGTRVALYSTAGALAVIRLVSAMDVLRLNRSAASRAGISLDTRPLPGGMDATLAVNF